MKTIQILLVAFFATTQANAQGIMLAGSAVEEPVFNIPTDYTAFFDFDNLTFTNLGSSDMSITFSNVTASTDVCGNVNSSVESNGDTQYMNFDNGGQLGDGSAFSVSFWVYPISTCPACANSSLAQIFTAIGNTTNPYFSMVWEPTPIAIRATFYDGSSVYLLKATDASYINRWVHVVVTYDKSSGAAKIYIDGVSKNTISAPNNINFSDALGIPRFFYESRNQDRFRLKGKLDDYIAYDRVLTSQEVSDIYNAKCN